VTPQELKARAAALQKVMQCNCDLDRWEPERDTGHSWVCRIHKQVKKEQRYRFMRQRGSDDE
jgi:hypothetical protein